MKRIFTLFLVVLPLCYAWPAMAESAAPTDSVAPTDTVSPTVAPSSSATPEGMLQQWEQLGALLRENGTYPFVELRKGDAGYDVTALQTRLAELGFYTKKVVDTFGKGTYNAMRLFEKANKLAVNGVASVADQKVLYGTSAVPASKEKTSSKRTDSTVVKETAKNVDASSSATK